MIKAQLERFWYYSHEFHIPINDKKWKFWLGKYNQVPADYISRQILLIDCFDLASFAFSPKVAKFWLLSQKRPNFGWIL